MSAARKDLAKRAISTGYDTRRIGLGRVVEPGNAGGGDNRNLSILPTMRREIVTTL